jgi:hypothetical protein
MYQSPFQGISLPQMGTPAYFYFRAVLPSGAAGTTAVRLGDLSVLTTPISVALAINHNVTEVGYFFPAIELEANPALPPAADSYSVWNFDVFGLNAAKTMPFGGAALDVPIGFMRPTLPGTGFAERETPAGA